MQHTTIAVDLAKNVFQVSVSHKAGRVSKRHRFSRPQFERFLNQLEPNTRVLMEACGTAHHWGRFVEGRGHTGVLLPPHWVRRYRGGNKTDAIDADAILEASRNERICPVPIKSVEQQALTSLHRMRAAWMKTRIARVNTLRAVLREYGVFIPLGARQALSEIHTLGHDPNSALPIPVRHLLSLGVEEIRSLEEKIKDSERQLRALSAALPAVANLLSVPGIGLITATALVAFIGDLSRFRTGRRFASFLGLVPREHSSGQQRRLGRINKQGNTYIRTMLIHGARAVLRRALAQPEKSSLHQWVSEVIKRRGRKVAAVALANKLARIAWVVSNEQREFRPIAI